MLHTVNIAVVATLGAIVLAFPGASIGARNTTPNRAAYALGKVIVSSSRSIHSIIRALLFVIMFGTGVLAVTFRSVGFVAKLLAKEIEEIDEHAVEAVRAAGGSDLGVLLYGVVPRVKAAFIGIAMYRWDITVREATIIGLVGAGGIGVELDDRSNAFDWRAVCTILLAILGVVVASEVRPANARGKVR